MGVQVLAELLPETNRIQLLSKEFHEDIPEKAKRVAGFRSKWDGDTFQYWHFPLSFVTCLELRRQFGKDLIIGIKLWDWSVAEKKRREELDNLKALEGFNLPRIKEVSPILAAALEDRSYQQVDCAFQSRVKRVLNANQPGTGKTLEIMASIVESECKGAIAVAAPSAAAKITWPEELGRWLPKERVYVVEGPRAYRQGTIDIWRRNLDRFPDERHWLICNFEIFRAARNRTRHCPEKGPFTWERTVNKVKEQGNWWHPFADVYDNEFSAFVADESHKALITQTPYITHMKQLHRAGLALAKVDPEGLKIAASGTPFRGKRYNLWGTLNWLDPNKYDSYWQWVQCWFETKRENPGENSAIGDIKPDKEQEFYKELDTIVIRRTKKECAPWLPDKQYGGRTLENGMGLGHWLEMGKEQAQLYSKMKLDAEVQLDGGTLIANGILAEMTRMKQFATSCGRLAKVKKKIDGKIQIIPVYKPALPSNKLDWLVEFLDERGIIGNEGGDQKVVVASQFTTIVNLFAEHLSNLGVSVFTLTGQTSDARRREYKERFQTEKDTRVFLINTYAGGTSLTLDAADDLVILDETWIPDDQEQVEDRIHRVSRNHQVTIHYLRSLGTIEERIAESGETLDSLQKKMLDGRRGIAFARKLLSGK